MAIVGIGADLVALGRIATLMGKHEGRGASLLARRVLSPQEHLEMHAKVKDEARTPAEDVQTRYIAVRWAAKEAVYKAVFPRLDLTWKDISVVAGPGGKPTATILAEGGQDVAVHLSVTHDAGLVLASAVAEQNTP